jgi:hypothetical protein
MIQMEHGSQFGHHGIAKMPAMICNDGFGYAKPSDYVIEKEKCCCLRIIGVCWHHLHPLCEIVHSHYNVMVASNGWRVARGKVNASFGEGTDRDNRME